MWQGGKEMLKQLNDTINYIEEHLLDEKVIDEAMKRVSVSELHFKNVFFFLTGMSINEYVKNRRLSEANYDLLHGKKVTDIAFKYGYQSMDGFTRAFKNWCGFLPSEISRRGEHKVFPKFNFIVKVNKKQLLLPLVNLILVQKAIKQKKQLLVLIKLKI